MRVAGHNASLITRGVSVRINGTQKRFDALVEDLGVQTESFEVDSDGARHVAHLHVLNTALTGAAIKYGTLLIDDKAGRTFRVLRKDQFDIKAVFVCVLE